MIQEDIKWLEGVKMKESSSEASNDKKEIHFNTHAKMHLFDQKSLMCLAKFSCSPRLMKYE
jgi:hypothetical protein